VSCHSLPLCRQTKNRAQDAVAGGLPSLVFEFGEVHQLTLSRQMPYAAAVFPRTQLFVRRQTNIVCLPASLCICLQHLTRRMDTTAMLIAGHLNQKFSTDSTQLAYGIIIQVSQTIAMCCEKQSLAPCREIACCFVVESDFRRDVCHRPDM